MKIIFQSLLFLSLLIFLTGCAGYSARTAENPAYGSWQREILSDGISYKAGLDIRTDNSYVWQPLSAAPGHTPSTGRFTLDGNLLTIVEDPDCAGRGVYQITTGGSVLFLTAEDDACEPRIDALQGMWIRSTSN